MKISINRVGKQRRNIDGEGDDDIDAGNDDDEIKTDTDIKFSTGWNVPRSNPQ